MTTHEFNNDSDQAERRRVERDTYLTRAQSDADLTSQGRFKKEIATRVTGVPSYPQLPASSPWSNAFDQNVELPLGYAVDAMPQEISRANAKRCFSRWRWFGWASRLAFSRQLGCDRSKELDWLIHHQAQGMVMRKRKADEWVCHDFPICTCGRASEYSAQPLHRYSANAIDVGDS